MMLSHILQLVLCVEITAVVVARVESLRGQIGESARGVEGLFESLLSESFQPD